LQREDLDFHLVVSNEAWYRDSWEMDQMIAFSRIIALATGRSVVRATNSGVSTVLAPDGGELDRIRVGGRDRSVRGVLAITVPVPSRGGAAGRSGGPFEAAPTAYVRWFGTWRLAWIALPFLTALAACRRSGNRPFSEG
jgi:apolipoprotein N-acyltransferase